jgi:hypothetical protein
VVGGRCAQVGVIAGDWFGSAAGWVRGSSVISISSSGGDGMLIVYARAGVAGGEKLAELDERRERDAGFGRQRHPGAGRGVEHPGGDLECPDRLGVEPAVTSGDAIPRGSRKDVDLSAVPGVKRVTNMPHIDQWGLVSPSCTNWSGGR